MNKRLSLVSVFLACMFLLAACGALQPNSQPGGVIQPASSIPPPQPEPEPEELSVRFSAVGDNLIHTGIYLEAAERAGGEGYDFAYAYENLAYFFEDYDVNWINQETLVNNELAPSSYPTFSTPGEMGQALYNAGWRVFALSNNHSYDKGAAGIAATLNFWQTMPEDIVYYGLYTDDESNAEIALQQVNGMTIAYVAYAEHTNGLPTPSQATAHVLYTENLPVMERQIRAARELADVVVVSLHWGVEDSYTVTDAQRELAASVGSWGADVIIGTGPHVIHPIEWITTEETGHQTLVAYSLGNFLSAQAYNRNMVGIALTFELHQTVDPDGTRHPATVNEVKAYPTVTHYDNGYHNIRDYMFRDYTEELAAQHGTRQRSTFSLEYITELCQQQIAPEFLVLD